jgi:hypothetical protein
MKLNDAQLAALARGATEAEIAALADAPTTSASASAEADVAAAAAAAAAPATGAATATAPPAEGQPAAAAAPAAPVDMTAQLTAQLADVNTQLVNARVEAEGFKAQVAQIEPMVAALRTVIGEKLVALGGTADLAAAYDASNIAAQFTRIDAIHKSQFRVGGVSAVAAPENKANTKIESDPMLDAVMQNSLVK